MSKLIGFFVVILCSVLAGCGSTPVREVVDIECEYDGERLSCKEVAAVPINYEGLKELGFRPYKLDQCFALVKNDMSRKELAFGDRCTLADGRIHER